MSENERQDGIVVKDLTLQWDSLDLNACSPICLLLDLFDSAYVKRIKWVCQKDLAGPGCYPWKILLARLAFGQHLQVGW